jgi:hypothetical protein
LSYSFKSSIKLKTALGGRWELGTTLEDSGAVTSSGDEGIGWFGWCETRGVVSWGGSFTSATEAIGNKVGIKSHIKPDTDRLREDVGGDNVDVEGTFSEEDGVGMVTWSMGVRVAREASWAIMLAGTAQVVRVPGALEGVGFRVSVWEARPVGFTGAVQEARTSGALGVIGWIENNWGVEQGVITTLSRHLR